jgi:hypothetical protein
MPVLLGGMMLGHHPQALRQIVADVEVPAGHRPT